MNLTRNENLQGASAQQEPLRDRMLDLAFREIYETGFCGLRVDTLIAKAGTTKGAFYHHFPSKSALGYAVVDEVLAGLADDVWGKHLASFADPIEGIEASALYAMQRLGPRCAELGCPFNNLAQEMSAIDNGFRERLGALFARIIANIAQALRRGQRDGHVRSNIDPDSTAHFTFSALEGTLGVVKTMGADASFDIGMQGLRQYLATLRP
ncbi:MAG: TetR/AcrR family transcriptional regulator [Hyphomicrobiaceae bacterium]|nr:TetR/AcrR family transcriptional regulator [Hyphomicrobiaceae bacterium]